MPAELLKPETLTGSFLLQSALETGLDLAEYQSVIHTVQNFTQSEEFTGWSRENRANPTRYPREFMNACAQMGILGMDTPENYGGNPLHPLIKLAVIEELARMDAGFALTALVQNSLTAFPIALAGSEAQKQKYLPGMAKGELIGCFALTDESGGSDATHLRTTAKDEGDFWVINGRKQFITSANAAGVMVLATRTGDPDSGKEGISAFVFDVNRAQPGLMISEPIHKAGQPGSQLCEITFENFRIPKDSLMGNLNKGWEEVFAPTLEHSRIWIAAQGNGISARAHELASEYVQRRGMYGKLESDIPDVVNLLNILARQLIISRHLALNAAIQEAKKEQDADAGRKVDRHLDLWASLAKLISGETAHFMALNASLLHGGMGYMDETPVTQLLKDAPVIRIYEGPAPVQIRVIMRTLKRLGLPRRSLDYFFPPGDALIRDYDELDSPVVVKAQTVIWERALQKIDKASE